MISTLFVYYNLFIFFVVIFAPIFAIYLQNEVVYDI